MRSRKCPEGARLTKGNIGVFQKLNPDDTPTDEQRTLHIAGDEDCDCGHTRVNGTAPLVSPFMGQEIGHIAAVTLPRQEPTTYMLAEIRELIPDDH